MTDEVDYDVEEEQKQESFANVGKKIKRKGRGHVGGGEEDRYDGRGGIFEKIEQDMSTSGPSQCKDISISWTAMNNNNNNKLLCSCGRLDRFCSKCTSGGTRRRYIGQIF